MKDLQKDKWIGESDDIITYIEVSPPFPHRALVPLRRQLRMVCTNMAMRHGAWQIVENPTYTTSHVQPQLFLSYNYLRNVLFSQDLNRCQASYIEFTRHDCIGVCAGKVP